MRRPDNNFLQKAKIVASLERKVVKSANAAPSAKCAALEENWLTIHRDLQLPSLTRLPGTRPSQIVLHIKS